MLRAVRHSCLKVLPGSHRYRTPQHEWGGHAAAAEINDQARQGVDVQEASSQMFADPAAAVDVHAEIGDLIIGDARCLHSAHPNQSEERRTCITLWYLDGYERLAPGMQKLYASPWGPGWSSGLSAEDAALVAPLRPPPPPVDTLATESFRGPVLEHLQLGPTPVAAKL